MLHKAQITDKLTCTRLIRILQEKWRILGNKFVHVSGAELRIFSGCVYGASGPLFSLFEAIIDLEYFWANLIVYLGLDFEGSLYISQSQGKIDNN